MKRTKNELVLDIPTINKPDVIMGDRPYLKPSFLRVELSFLVDKPWKASDSSRVIIFGRLYGEDGSLGEQEGSYILALPFSGNERNVPYWVPDIVREATQKCKPMI